MICAAFGKYWLSTEFSAAFRRFREGFDGCAELGGE